MPPNKEDRRPAAGGAAIQEKAGQPTQIVTDRRAAERARRIRRWACRELDDMLGITRPGGLIDYHASGLDLGMPERRSAGLALLDRERAA